MTDEQIKRLADAAAKWWADCLRGEPVFDNGDARVGSLAAVLAPPQDSADILRDFEGWLSESVRLELAKGLGVFLEVDYGPRGILREVADRAGIQSSRLPWKTKMRISEREGVVASKGYGQPYITVSEPVSSGGSTAPA